MFRSLFCLALGLVALSANAPGDLPQPRPRGSRVDHPVWGCCRASSGETHSKSGGFAPSGNDPIPIPEGVVAPAGELALLVLPDRLPRPEFGYAMTVLLTNRTGKTLWFNAIDSSLPIFQEARDEAGDWKSIEYSWTDDVHAWCGNSYHQVALPSGKCWVFAVPRYLGPRQTQLRIRFEGPHGRVLSAPFNGGVYLGQLQDHVPGKAPRLWFDPRTGFHRRSCP